MTIYISVIILLLKETFFLRLQAEKVVLSTEKQEELEHFIECFRKFNNDLKTIVVDYNSDKDFEEQILTSFHTTCLDELNLINCIKEGFAIYQNEQSSFNVVKDILNKILYKMSKKNFDNSETSKELSPQKVKKLN